MASTARDRRLLIRPLTAARVDDVKLVTAGTWGATCWGLFPRFTEKQQRELGLRGAKRREMLARLARDAPLDDLAVWVIACITVRRGYRGRGVAIAMIRAAVA